MPTIDFAVARRNMVESQLRPNRVIDEHLVDAMASVPRESFVPEALRGVAYMDEDLAIGGGRYLMEPMVLGRLLQEAEIGPGDVVLDVGTASGYSAAVLGRLAGTVVALECDPDLAARAVASLAEQGSDSVIVVQGPLQNGWPDQAPFDLIVLQGAVEQVPAALTDQLAEGGRLAGVVRSDGVGKAMLYQRFGGLVSGRVLFDAATPLLPGFALEPGFVF